MCQRLFSLFALLNAGLLLAQTTDPTVEWRLDRVECHEVGAMLSFVGDVSHRAGQGTLLLDGLPSDVDVSNATIELPEGVRLVAVDLVHRASDVQREVQDVEAQLAGERLALALEEALLEALDQERAFLQANRAIGGESEVLLVDDVEEMRHYVAQRHRELALERVDLVTNIQALARSVEDLERTLATLVARGRDTHPALSLVVQGSGSGTAKVRVATALAGWVSSYDVSWQEADRALKVDRYARVVQSTGWPWENVEIVFRTGQPLSELAAPTGQAQEVQLRDEPAFKSAYCASYEWVNSGLTNIQAREDVLRGQASFASTWSMGGNTRVTLDGEGRPSRVFLDSHMFEATPKWSLDAQVTDAASRSTHFDGWMDAQLLSGEGRIFQGNAMVGVVPFNVPAWGDSWKFSWDGTATCTSHGRCCRTAAEPKNSAANAKSSRCDPCKCTTTNPNPSRSTWWSGCRSRPASRWRLWPSTAGCGIPSWEAFGGKASPFLPAKPGPRSSRSPFGCLAGWW